MRYTLSSLSACGTHFRAYTLAATYMMGGAGALKRSDSISVSSPAVTRKPVDMMDEMMDAAESMSLDDKELQEAAEQARALMEENSRR